MTNAETGPSTAAVLQAALADARTAVRQRAREVASIVAAVQGSATDDEHDPEGATLAFERAQAAALLHQAQQRVAALEAAVARLSTGDYGRCLGCGEGIDAERLAARPTATRCRRCAQQR